MTHIIQQIKYFFSDPNQTPESWVLPKMRMVIGKTKTGGMVPGYDHTSTLKLLDLGDVLHDLVVHGRALSLLLLQKSDPVFELSGIIVACHHERCLVKILSTTDFVIFVFFYHFMYTYVDKLVNFDSS